MLADTVKKLKSDFMLNETKLKQNEDTIKENCKKLDEQDNEINTLKKVILQQQIFMESTLRSKLAKNMMITGIPIEDVVWNEQTISDNNENVMAILSSIDISLNEDAYELKLFDSDNERPTFSAKLIFNDITDKNDVLSNAKKLQDCECEKLKEVFIKNDETKLLRNENYRLRQKRRTLKRENPTAEFKIEKGKLFQNGVEVDKFDLNNQIFC